MRFLIEELRTLLAEGKLNGAQRDALEKISQSGGHGYGEYAYLNRRTAQALEKMGLVKLGYRKMGDGRSKGWGRITLKGIWILAALRAKDVDGELYDKIATQLINGNSDLLSDFQREREGLGDRKTVVAKYL